MCIRDRLYDMRDEQEQHEQKTVDAARHGQGNEVVQLSLIHI